MLQIYHIFLAVAGAILLNRPGLLKMFSNAYNNFTDMKWLSYISTGMFIVFWAIDFLFFYALFTAAAELIAEGHLALILGVTLTFVAMRLVSNIVWQYVRTEDATNDNGIRMQGLLKAISCLFVAISCAAIVSLAGFILFEMDSFSKNWVRPSIKTSMIIYAVAGGVALVLFFLHLFFRPNRRGS